MEKMNTFLSYSDCEKIINNAVQNSAIELIDFEIKPLSEKPLGYLAEHYKLTITYKIKNEDQNLEKTFFVKTMPLFNDNQREYVNKMGVFQKEVKVYENVISPLQELTEPFAARFYYQVNSEIIVLEDLTLKNYQVSSSNYLNEQQCLAGLECLARFHGASLIFEEKKSVEGQPFRFNDHLVEELQETTFSYMEGHPRNKWLITVTDCLVQLSSYFTSDKEVASNISNYIFNIFPKYIKPSTKYRNVITHDDLWCNNIMFGDGDECALVDFQLTRYSPPVFDVLLFLYVNLANEYFAKNKGRLFEFYYSKLENVLAKQNVILDTIIPKNDFYESIKYYSLPALIEASMYGTNVFIPADLSEQIVADKEIFEEFAFKNRAKFILEQFNKNNQFKDRFTQVLSPLYDFFAYDTVEVY